MSKKTLFSIAIILILGIIAALAFVRVSPPVDVVSSAIQPAPATLPNSCTSLEQCGPGCYKGKRYSYKVCAAVVGSSICSAKWVGEEICAMPDYDPERAYREMKQKEWDALTRGKK